VEAKAMKVAALAKERFALLHPKGCPQLFDTIVSLCNEHGFSPNVESEPDLLQTALTLIVPSCAISLRVDGVTLLRMRPDRVRIELVIAWPKYSDSAVTKTLLDLVKKSHDMIHRKANLFS
jgi:hypothetical protein